MTLHFDWLHAPRWMAHAHVNRAMTIVLGVIGVSLLFSALRVVDAAVSGALIERHARSRRAGGLRHARPPGDADRHRAPGFRRAGGRSPTVEVPPAAAEAISPLSRRKIFDGRTRHPGSLCVRSAHSLKPRYAHPKSLPAANSNRKPEELARYLNRAAHPKSLPAANSRTALRAPEEFACGQLPDRATRCPGEVWPAANSTDRATRARRVWPSAANSRTALRASEEFACGQLPDRATCARRVCLRPTPGPRYARFLSFHRPGACVD